MMCDPSDAHDTVIVFDNTGGLDDDQCNIYLDKISDLVYALVNADDSRVALVEVHDTDCRTLVGLDDPFNDDSMAYIDFIQSIGCEYGHGHTAIACGILEGVYELKSKQRDANKQIIVISNCQGTDKGCSHIHKYLPDDVVITMINILGASCFYHSNGIEWPSKYSLCLADHICVAGDVTYEDIGNAFKECQGKRCNPDQPYPQPTKLPSNKPKSDDKYEPPQSRGWWKETKSPTKRPTPKPTDEDVSVPLTQSPKPTSLPTPDPTSEPTSEPSSKPTTPSPTTPSPTTPKPTANPTLEPTTKPPTTSPTDSASSDEDSTTTTHMPTTGSPVSTGPLTNAPKPTTAQPTADPTYKPYKKDSHDDESYEEYKECMNPIDLIILYDNTCNLLSEDCDALLRGIAGIVTEVQTEFIGLMDGEEPFVNLQIMEVQPKGAAKTVIPFGDPSLFGNPEEFEQRLLAAGDCTADGEGHTDLNGALKEAIQSFDKYDDRDDKIVIISACFDDQEEKVCGPTAHKLYKNYIDVFSFNLFAASNAQNVINDISLAEMYPLCLLDDDEYRLCIGDEDDGVSMDDVIDGFKYCILPKLCKDKKKKRKPKWPTKWPTKKPSKSEEPTTAGPTWEDMTTTTLMPSTDMPTAPTVTTARPTTVSPTSNPTAPTPYPTQPTMEPTPHPTMRPSMAPTDESSSDDDTTTTFMPSTAEPAQPTVTTPRPTTLQPTEDPTDDSSETHMAQDPLSVFPVEPQNVGLQLGPVRSSVCPNNGPDVDENIDFVVFIDNSCKLSDEKCEMLLDGVGKIINTLLKFDGARVATIDFGEDKNDVEVIADFNDEELQNDGDEYADYIARKGECTDNGNGESDLQSAIERGIELLGGDGSGRRRQFVIVSGCIDDHIKLCSTLKQQLHAANVGVDVVNLVNAGNVFNAIRSIEKASSYLSCLVDDDKDRICIADFSDGFDVSSEFDGLLDQCLVPNICKSASSLKNPKPAALQLPAAASSQSVTDGLCDDDISPDKQLDFVIFLDNSCKLSDSDCNAVLHGTASLIRKLLQSPVRRVGVMQFSSGSPGSKILIDLEEDALQENEDEFIDRFKDEAECTDGGWGHTNLGRAVGDANRLTNTQRKTKYIVISGCQDMAQRICNPELVNELKHQKIEVYPINLILNQNDEQIANLIGSQDAAQSYLRCLSDDDEDNICIEDGSSGINKDEFNQMTEDCLIPKICASLSGQTVIV